MIVAYDVTSLPIEWDHQYRNEHEMAMEALEPYRAFLAAAANPRLNTTINERDRTYIGRFGRPPDVSSRILLLQQFREGLEAQYAVLFVEAHKSGEHLDETLADLDNMFRLVSPPNPADASAAASSIIANAPCLAFVRIDCDCPEDVATEIEQLTFRLARARFLR